jgi:hypothetical protein
MDRLIGYIRVSHGSLAGTEIGEDCLRCIQMQHVFDSDPPVLHHKRAAERIRVLHAVASKMNHVSWGFLQESAQERERGVR